MGFETFPKSSPEPHDFSENKCGGKTTMKSPHASGGKPEYNSVRSADRYPQSRLLGEKSTRKSTQMENSFAKGGGNSNYELYPQVAGGSNHLKDTTPGGSLDKLVKATSVKAKPA